jgi:hypothetical protein
MALGWIGSTIAFGDSRQETVDQVRAGDRFGLGAAVTFELGPEPTEGKQRSVVVQREPNDCPSFSFPGLRTANNSFTKFEFNQAWLAEI